jgi:RNA polymerase sigma factor CnrH
MLVISDRCARRDDPVARIWGECTDRCWSFGGEAALSVEARFLEPDLPEELQAAYAQTFDRLRRMFRARGCTAEEAADLAQDAAVRAYVHIRRWGVNGTGLDPLLNRIARNLLIDRYRRTTPHIVPLDDAGELHDPDQDPTEEFARRQRTRAVRTAIQDLPARHQAAITYSLSGLSPEEVGRQMGIGRNAADALLHRARRSLKERLQTVGEGMFGFALGIRVRWDRFTGRAGGHALSENGLAAGLQAGAVVASMAVAAVLSVVASVPPGGGDDGWSIIPAKALLNSSAPAGAVEGAASGGGAETVSGAVGFGEAANVQTYNLGPTQTTWSPKGIDNTTNVPGPKGPEGEPFITGTGYLHGKGTHEPTAGDPGFLIARTVCGAASILCTDPSGS